MDYKRFELLVRVAEHGSFSKAASVIGVAQPALGRQIRKLEEDCGTPLLYRHGRGVSLTPEGERVVERVRPLLKQMEGVVSELRAERESPSGTVMLGITPTLCRLIGLKLVSECRRLYPSLRLNVMTGYSGYVHEWLTSARIDIAVLHDARRAQQVAVEHIGDLRLSLVSPAATVAAGEFRPEISMRALQDISLALPARHHGLRRTIETAASKAGISLNVSYEIDDLQLVLDLVQAGYAHTILAAPVVSQLVKSGAVLSRLITDPPLATRLMLAQASNRPSTRATRVIGGILKDLVAEVTTQ